MSHSERTTLGMIAKSEFSGARKRYGDALRHLRGFYIGCWMGDIEICYIIVNFDKTNVRRIFNQIIELPLSDNEKYINAVKTLNENLDAFWKFKSRNQEWVKTQLKYTQL